MDAASDIKARAAALGFDAAGIARATQGPEARARLAAFLGEGAHGTMTWLADRAEQRSHPQALWPEAVSVVSLGLSYAPADDPMAVLAQPDRNPRNPSSHSHPTRPPVCCLLSVSRCSLYIAHC